ncbi:MAG: TonB-dependent receptor [Bacteroidales bacterium]|jgi:iron complex outermembrane receptor protein|nr:TonB-dependent receptor [Bacteroidales bacterium]
MKTINLFSKIILTAALLAMVTIGFAQQDTLVLDEILITAKSPFNLTKSNIQGQTIQIENPHDGGAMFINQAGFGVEKRGNYGMEPVLRGFKYSQLTVLIDGGIHSTNACPNRMDPTISQVAPEEIEKIEVIKGPFSVRYGAALGGIINVVNRRPDRSSSQTVTGSVEAGYQSNGGNIYSNLFVQSVMNKFDVSINAGYKDYGNYESGSGQEIASSFSRFGYAMKLGYQFSDKQRLQLSWRQSMAKDVLYAGLPMDADKDNSSILSLDYAANNISPLLKSFKLKMYGSYVDHEMSNKLRPAYKAVQAVSPVTAQVFGGRTEFGLQTSASNLLFAGLDFKHIGKDGGRDRLVFKNTCTGMEFDPPKYFFDKTWQDSNHDDFGVFLENKRDIGTNLVWTLGIRSDYVTYSINDPDAGFSEQYNGNIKPDDRFDLSATTSFTWFLPKGYNLFVAVARATRSPELTELFINHLSVGMDAYEYLGNPNLKSEVNNQFDLRAERKLNKLNLFADVYVAYVNNYITAAVDTTIPRIYNACMEPKFTKVFTNVDEALLTGFEAGFDWQFAKGWQYKLAVSYVYGQNLDWDEPLPEITPLTLQTAVAYKNNYFHAEIHGRIVDAQDRVSARFNETASPGFGVFDFYADYTVLGSLQMMAGVRNIFNKNYVEHLSRAYKGMDTNSLYFEPGRSFNIGLKYKF